MNKRSFIRIVAGVLLIVFLLAVAGFVIWAETPLGPMPEALQALKTDDTVRVESDSFITFWPQNQEPVSGVVLYPGGRVDPRSYAPAARAIAEYGYLAVITPMPLNLAVLNSSAAEDVITAYPEIKTWIVGGHSLGGTMAAGYAEANADIVDGLLLWASYPADDALSARSAPSVLSIYATNDGLSTLEDIEASRANLPQHTRWVEITGGNHAQFGWYGEQPGDGQATISRLEQQEQIVAGTVQFLETLAAQAPGR
jgi:pimeloyl-ACP methyl ester carboxylesterase